jgi:CheY-like chemotaxis protein
MSSLNLNLASEQATPELVIEAAATGRTGLESARVLLVDDSVMLRMGLRRSLEAVGLKNIREANNGKEAIEILMREPFDLMLLDMEMPVMSGMEVLEVRALTTPCVALSSALKTICPSLLTRFCCVRV